MKVYKFGGASVKDAAGIENLKRILSMTKDNLMVVISAMGKTTNGLETVVNQLWEHNNPAAQTALQTIWDYHQTIIHDLGLTLSAKELFPDTILQMPLGTNYDRFYDQIVSLGELASTRIIHAYLVAQGMDAEWLDMTHILRTDSTFREAGVDIPASQEALGKKVGNSLEDASLPVRGERLVYIAQGFIGGTEDGLRTTLGREGSDYTAALVANMLDAESVTIWKDVPGILNADPRLVENTVLIDELSYIEAVELAYSGAQVIHPKTIRPLENKRIPLYVKPFGDPTAAGSIIHATDKKIDVPVYIWRKNQLLITLRAKDFSFMLEESLSHIFDIIHRHRLKVSLIQSSAVTISVCVDNTRYVQDAMNELQSAYRVTYNEGLNLLTIRGTSPDILRQEQEGREVLLTQLTRRTARLVVKR